MIKPGQYGEVISPSVLAQSPPSAEKSQPAGGSDAESKLKEAFEKARQIVDAASAYSSAQMREATERMNRESAEAMARSRDEGFERGYSEGRKTGEEQGYADGYREGEKLAREENREMAEALQMLLEHLEDAKTSVLDEFRDRLTDLAVQIAGNILKKELETSAEGLASIIEKALDQYQDEEWVRVYLSPSVAKRLAEPVGDPPYRLTERLSQVTRAMKLVPCQEFGDTDCVIEIPSEVIDAGVESQLKKIHSVISW